MKQKVSLQIEPYVFKKTKIVKRVSYNKSYWLYNKQYFFKYSIHNPNDTSPIVNEILVSKLCEQLGVNCVKYGYGLNLHKNYEHRGVIAKSFLNENEKSITLSQIWEQEVLSKYPKDMYLKMMVIFARICPITTVMKYKDLNIIAKNLILKYEKNSKLLLPFDKTFIKNNINVLKEIEEQTKTEKFLEIEECERRINYFVKQNGLKLEGNTKLELQKMAIIDAITKQVDRHAGNISLIYDKTKGVARLAPMYDNALSEYFGIDTPLLPYPLQLNCYIKLSKKDCDEINDNQTEIAKFYQKVCNFYDDGKLDLFLDNLREQFLVIDSCRTKHLDKKIGKLIKREKDDYYWFDAKRNYGDGLKYIDKNLKQYESYNNFVCNDNGDVKKSFLK